MAAKGKKVFGGGGLSGYADQQRKSKDSKPLFQPFEQIMKGAKKR